FVEAVDLADGVESHGSLPPGRNERGNLPDGPAEVVIYHDRVVGTALSDLLTRGREAPRDGLLGLGPAPAQPPLELLERRRRDEDEAPRHLVATERGCALDVDHQEADEPAADDRLDGVARRPVEAAVDLRVLEELAAGDPLAERGAREEVVVDAVLL